MKKIIKYRLEENEIKEIKELMKKIKITYEKLAKEYGCTRAFMFTMINGKKNINDKMINIIEKNLGFILHK